jgi:hypothetical protein
MALLENKRRICSLSSARADVGLAAELHQEWLDEFLGILKANSPRG